MTMIEADTLSFSGACALAERIEKYWQRQGRSIVTEIVPVGVLANSVTCYGVRSDMVGGLPVGRGWAA